MKPRRTTTDSGTPEGRISPFRDWKVVALLSGLLCVFFWKILLGSAWLWEDMLMFSYPIRAFAATSLAMGQLPLWNPYTFNGMPFLADIQTTVLYLPCLALTLFVHDGILNFYWLEAMVLAHYVVAGWGMFILASSFDLKRAPAFFAGATYMLSGFMITHAIHQQIITLVAWYPLILYFFRRSLVEPGWRWVFVTALLLALSTLAGFPQLSLYLHLFLFAYFVFVLLTSFTGRELASRLAGTAALKAAAVILFALALAAIQLLPTMELADLSQRAQITYEKSTEGQLAWSQLITFLFPKFFGTAGAQGYSYWGPGTYWYFWETCVYLGILPLLLAALSFRLCRKNPLVLFLWGTAAFAILFALGDNFFLHRLFFNYVPGFSRFRDPARIGIFLSFAVSLLAAFSLGKLLDTRTTISRPGVLRNILLSLAAVGVLWWLGIVSGFLDDLFPFLKNASAAPLVRASSHVSLVVLLGSVAAVLYLIFRRPPSRTAAVVLTGVFFLDMFIFGGEQNTASVNPGDYFRRAESVVRFLRADARHEIFRVNTRNQYGMIMDRNQGMVDRIRIMEGYTPLTLQRAYAPYRTEGQRDDLLNLKYVTIADLAHGTLSLKPYPSVLPHAFFLYDIRVARSEEDLLAAFADTTWSHRTTALLRRDPPLPIAVPSHPPVWKARITKDQDNLMALEVETSDDGLLVVSEIFYPGWLVTVDGAAAEILETDYNLRGVFVPHGSHAVVFRFENPPFVRGAWITAAALFCCLTGIAYPSVQRFRLRKGDR